jgi:hypothetical protein
MLYIVVMKEKGEGCDYSIGCGVMYDIVDAESDEDAWSKARELWFTEEYDEHDEPFVCFWDLEQHSSCIDEVYVGRLVPGGDVKDWIKIAESNQEAWRDRRQKEKDIAELKRLQEKYK